MSTEFSLYGKTTKGKQVELIKVNYGVIQYSEPKDNSFHDTPSIQLTLPNFEGRLHSHDLNTLRQILVSIGCAGLDSLNVDIANMGLHAADRIILISGHENILKASEFLAAALQHYQPQPVDLARIMILGDFIAATRMDSFKISLAEFAMQFYNVLTPYFNKENKSATEQTASEASVIFYNLIAGFLGQANKIDFLDVTHRDTVYQLIKTLVDNLTHELQSVSSLSDDTDAPRKRSTSTAAAIAFFQNNVASNAEKIIACANSTLGQTTITINPVTLASVSASHPSSEQDTSLFEDQGQEQEQELLTSESDELQLQSDDLAHYNQSNSRMSF